MTSSNWNRWHDALLAQDLTVAEHRLALALGRLLLGWNRVEAYLGEELIRKTAGNMDGRTLVRARAALIAKGLLRYEPGSRGRGNRGHYKLLLGSLEKPAPQRVNETAEKPAPQRVKRADVKTRSRGTQKPALQRGRRGIGKGKAPGTISKTLQAKAIEAYLAAGGQLELDDWKGALVRQATQLAQVGVDETLILAAVAALGREREFPGFLKQRLEQLEAEGGPCNWPGLDRSRLSPEQLAECSCHRCGNARVVREAQRAFTPEQLARLDEAGGMTMTKATLTRARVAAKATNTAANFWQRINDQFERRTAVAHEAHNAGYRGVEGLRKLLTDPAAAKDLNRVSRRADDAMIKYGGRSTPTDSAAARLFTSWPWLRGALRYSANFPFEHPYQSVLAGQFGEHGRQELQSFYAKHGGRVPASLERILPTRYGGFDTGMLPTGVQETAGKVLEDLLGLRKHPGQYSASLAAELGPGAEGLSELPTGRNRFGQQIGLGGVLGDVARRELPVGAYLTATRKATPNQTYATGAGAGLSRILGDPFAHYNWNAAAQKGLKDYAAGLPAEQRIKFNSGHKASLVESTVAHLVADPKVPDAVKAVLRMPGFASGVASALSADADYQLAQFKLAQSKGVKVTDLSKPAYAADSTKLSLDYAGSHGVPAPVIEQLQHALDYAGSHPADAAAIYKNVSRAAREAADATGRGYLRAYQRFVKQYAGATP